jgi:hypothetical protein
MRSLLIVTLLSLTLAAQAQKNKETAPAPSLPVNSETGLISFDGVMDISGINKDGLYERAMKWAQGYYKNPNDVLREKDPAAGKMVIKARFKIYNPADKKGLTTDAGDVMYTLTLQFKDGKYKYELTKCTWMQASAFPCERWNDTASPSYKKEYAHYLTQLDAKASEVLLALKKVMTASGEGKKDDW